MDPDFVESTEGLRSFAVSIGIALFLGIRWFRTRRHRQQEHRLDRYMRSVLDIERRQIGLDDHAHVDDIESLQRLLDEVTMLRQEALSLFSAHEFREDSAADCFIGMCHALSDKINAKLSRQRLERRFEALTAVMAHQDAPPPSPSISGSDNAPSD